MAKEVLKTAGLLGGLALIRSQATAAGVAWRAHRELAHGSIEVQTLLARVIDLEQKASSTNTKEWAAAHRELHHQFSDVDLYPFRQTYLAILEAEKKGMQVPTEFKGYDRLVDSFTLEEMKSIGEMADTYLRSKLGDRYQEPPSLTDKGITERLKDEKPKYWYDVKLYDKKHILTYDEIEHILVRDQHSPLLAPENADGTWNGVRWIFRKNIKAASLATRMYRQNPWLMPEDLSSKSTDPIKGNTDKVAAGFVAAGLIALLMQDDKNLNAVIKAAILGSAVEGGGLAFLGLGSSIVNAFGHMGPMTPETIRQAIMSRNFEITPYIGGKVSSDTEKGGVVGKMLGKITKREASNQAGHHLEPDAIVYPNSEGEVAPSILTYGKHIDWMARNKYIPFVKPGKGIPVNAEGRRADYPHPAVGVIESARERTRLVRSQEKGITG